MHQISAVVGGRDVIERLRGHHEQTRIVELPQGFALLPATRAWLETLGAPPNVPGFYHLHEALDRLLAAASKDEAIVYVETEYFGGPGGQAAAVFRSGRREWVGSSHEDEEIGDDESSISTALRAIGVVRGRAIDEFETLDLGLHRTTEDWFAAGR